MKGNTEFPLIYYLFAMILGGLLVFTAFSSPAATIALLALSTAAFLISQRSVNRFLWLAFFVAGSSLQVIVPRNFEPGNVEYTGYVTRGGTGLVEASEGKILINGNWFSLRDTVQIRLSKSSEELYTGQIIWAAGKMEVRSIFPLYIIDSSADGHFDRFRLLSLPGRYSRDKLKKYGLLDTMACSVFLGDKRSMESNTKNEISDLGVAHLFAVSGLHIGMMYLFANYALSRFLLGRRTKLILSASLIFLYTMATGPSISAMRSFLMLAIYSFFRFIDYRQHPLNVLGLTGIIMTLSQPSIVASISFQLSFFATAMLLIFLPVFTGYNLMFQAFMTGVIAQIAIVPLSLNVFGTLSVASIPLTILMVPLFIIPSYIGVISLMIFDALNLSPICDFLAGALKQLSKIFVISTETISGLIPVMRLEGVAAYLVSLSLLFCVFFSLWHFGHKP
ncbi:MAG TPA: ComEC/Rec2 family competence protein [Mesotoga infera]|uniref:ComEC/Rec2-related protein n=1 Tax=Mesotoga infera TaxID=1236046 RepID=A0A7Z7PR68_9BACT|nr:ComEC/Rec2 family competence protein [Mesotoga infera]HRR43023.1 ComEC/Rec2 family competence protein [Mesotoga sp.]SSC13206.1 ComEC/Rec2-related protein [Mesotoga infera]HOI33811.1 ComEC/Rec2 family competence protein [Mesotoga infera]HON28469.1 ComEC/Rec2 family competence protein [Mesotoga infera]HPD37067.1 ComEC/Rec2 family competence protein [Mesotoga infera]